MDKIRRAVAQAGRTKAEVHEQRRLVAVQADRRGGPPPRTLQRRPGDAVVLKALPGITRPRSRCRRPVVWLILESARPLAQVQAQRENGGKAAVVFKKWRRLVMSAPWGWWPRRIERFGGGLVRLRGGDAILTPTTYCVTDLNSSTIHARWRVLRFSSSVTLVVVLLGVLLLLARSATKARKIKLDNADDRLIQSVMVNDHLVVMPVT